MQGDYMRGLRIVAERKGWDPTKIDGTPIEVGLKKVPPNSKGDVSLSPFVGPPADTNPDNPVLGQSIDWANPRTDQVNMDRRTEGADPTPGMPGA